MAKIPQYVDRTTIRSAGQPNVSRSPAVGRGVQQFGRGISQAAGTAVDLTLENRKREKFDSDSELRILDNQWEASGVNDEAQISATGEGWADFKTEERGRQLDEWRQKQPEHLKEWADRQVEIRVARSRTAAVGQEFDQRNRFETNELRKVGDGAVDAVRRGASPEEAVKEVIERVNSTITLSDEAKNKLREGLVPRLRDADWLGRYERAGTQEEKDALRREASLPIAELPKGDVIQQVQGKLHKFEGTGKNPGSSAYGHYQFLNQTWLDNISEAAPELIAGKSRRQILAMRGDRQVADRVFRHWMGKNQKTLEARGVPVTGGTLYGAHFSGPGRMVNVAKADPNTPVTAFYSDEEIKKNPAVFKGVTTTGELIASFDKAVGGKGGTPQYGTPTGRYAGMDYKSQQNLARQADAIDNNKQQMFRVRYGNQVVAAEADANAQLASTGQTSIPEPSQELYNDIYGFDGDQKWREAMLARETTAQLHGYQNLPVSEIDTDLAETQRMIADPANAAQAAELTQVLKAKQAARAQIVKANTEAPLDATLSARPDVAEMYRTAKDPAGRQAAGEQAWNAMEERGIPENQRQLIPKNNMAAAVETLKSEETNSREKADIIGGMLAYGGTVRQKQVIAAQIAAATGQNEWFPIVEMLASGNPVERLSAEYFIDAMAHKDLKPLKGKDKKEYMTQSQELYRANFVEEDANGMVLYGTDMGSSGNVMQARAAHDLAMKASRVEADVNGGDAEDYYDANLARIISSKPVVNTTTGYLGFGVPVKVAPPKGMTADQLEGAIDSMTGNMDTLFAQYDAAVDAQAQSSIEYLEKTKPEGWQMSRAHVMQAAEEQKQTARVGTEIRNVGKAGLGLWNPRLSYLTNQSGSKIYMTWQELGEAG